MDSFQAKLLALDSETCWTEQDIMDPAAGQNLLKSFFQDVLDTLISSNCPPCHSAYIAIAGIVPEEFVPVVAYGRKISEFARIHITRDETAVSDFLNNAKLVSFVRNVHNNPHYKGPLPYCEKLLVQLRGYGELFAFISFDFDKEGVLTEEFAQTVTAYQPLISRICADAVFSMRLREMALPFEAAAKTDTLVDLYQEIVDRTIRAFAADGVVLRINDRESDRLIAEAFAPIDNSHGDDEIARVSDTLLSENSVGEEICRLVYEDEEHTWTVGMLENGAEQEFSGTAISKEMDDVLRSLGIRAYCVFQLVSNVEAGNEGIEIGTLSFFHRHQHRYSWRDISLANSLCQRAADAVALFNKTRELRTTNERMFLDGQMMTRVEIVTLLTHDLGHKVINIHAQQEEFIGDVKKTFRKEGNFSNVENAAKEMLAASDVMMRSLDSINTLFKARGAQGTPESTTFLLVGVVEEVKTTMKDALGRNKCSITARIINNISLYGNRAILLQAMFNLVINAIDAQRSKKNPKNNQITISAEHELQGSGNTVVVKIWDEGPGINRKVFNVASDIFKLGATSKESGTGRGLTISRGLLGEFFGANLTLLDPKTAMFKITFPVNQRGKK
ncbi:HAMP domain-containing sensor histidine kinase [Neptuniibacter sp.]|uniref:sensor histidine kinase n=1 Tax=Neptuniibacter sp. TaxID=1962643 RepID=UPI00260BDDFC|nr:HAMP domain-containing sensor histidine kinase [Neptuniibacter sp.]MCP4597280.1 HAMP domain-containing histidine kinase [Neptuniibacter sp.]